jgi:chemotaxis signal transduction protein
MNHEVRGRLLPASEIGRAFDASFAALPSGRDEEVERLLALRIRKDAYAIRIREMAGFAAARKVVPIPSSIPEMLGLAGFRGVVLPVYSLAALIGYGLDDGPLRWFILCGGADKIALGFADLDGYLELPRSELRAAERRDDESTQVAEVVSAGGEARAILGVSVLLGRIERKVAAAVAALGLPPGAPVRSGNT